MIPAAGGVARCPCSIEFIFGKTGALIFFYKDPRIRSSGTDIGKVHPRWNDFLRKEKMSVNVGLTIRRLFL